jgi:starch-binding outer membrane protein, SusD/RagB family
MYMYKNKLLFLSLILVIGTMSCSKKELNVGNPNSPTVASDVTNESSLISYAKGAVYINGFQSANAFNWLGSGYFSLSYGYSELLADMVSSTDANEIINTVNIPSYVTLDDGTKFPATPNQPNYQLLRVGNTRAATAAGYNPLYYQWCNMYILNGACNTILATIPTVPNLSPDAVSTFEAWAYFWKGYAYSVIGTQYIAGLEVNTAGATNNNYVIRDSIINQSNYWFGQAASVLAGLGSGSSDYNTVLSGLIPYDFAHTPHGGVLTPAMWIRNINTMLARNILENKLAPFVNGNLNASISGASIPSMSQSDWQNVLTLAGNGIQTGDYVFSATSSNVNSLYGQTSGNVSLMAAGPNTTTVFVVGLRMIQNFNANDKRLSLNFSQTPADIFLNDYFSSTVSLNNTDNGSGGTVYNYGDQDQGAYETFIAGSWEENQLMLAEANLRLGNTAPGLAQIDAVRTYQGAGVASVAGITDATAAYKELVKERRVALFGRGVSFWDARRWGWTYDISQGGGSYGNMFLYTPSSGNPVMNTNATFNYNYMDYWDVPADEVQLNPPASGTESVVINPNYK